MGRLRDLGMTSPSGFKFTAMPGLEKIVARIWWQGLVFSA